MSFEAVPCMFKGRAEDGNEASMFGLLIRPAASTAQQVNSSSAVTSSSSAPSVSAAISIPSTSGAIPITGTAIQIVPSSHHQTGNSATALSKAQAKLCTPPPIVSTSTKSHHGSRSKTSTSAQSTSTSSHSGMIPISPKVSLLPQKILPSTSSAMHHHSHFATTNGLTPAILQPQFVQIQPINFPWNTTSHYPSSTATLIPYNTSHGINSFSAMQASTSTAYAMQPMQHHVYHDYNPKNDTNSAEHGKGPLARAKTGFESPSPSQVVPQMLHGQTQAHCVESGQSDPITTATTSSAYLSSQSSKSATFTPAHCSPSLKQIHGKSGDDLSLSRIGQAHSHILAHEDSREGSEELGDLNSIDYTQLVAANSAIITTEDYLQGGGHSTLTFSHDTASHNIPGDMCPQATSQVGVTQQIGIHIDDQHNAGFNKRDGENGRPQEESSLLQKAQYPQFRYADHANGNTMGRQNHQQQQQMGPVNTSAWHNNTSATGHHPSPYMGGNQAVSSFTPDSGIDSGSPPSISSYTPPMVSPYTTQVTSSECASNGQYPLSNLNMSVASNSSVNTVKSSSNGDDHFDDYSDMPTLLPAFADHDSQRECTVDREDLDYNNMTPPAIMDSTAPTMSPPSVLDCSQPIGLKTLPDSDKESKIQEETIVDKAAGQQNQKEQLLFTSTMDLHELAERLASSIDLEQLTQLTSLIQSKAASTNKFKEGTNIAADKNVKAKHANCSEKVKNAEPVFEKSRDISPEPECTIQDMDTSDDEQTPEKPENDEVTRCRISVYRRQVREKLNQKLRSLVESLETSFERVDLDMGPGVKFALPWQHLDWPNVKRRIINQKPLEFGANLHHLADRENTSQLNMDSCNSKNRRKRKRSKESPAKVPKIVSETEFSDSEQSSVKSKRRKSSVNGRVKNEPTLKPNQNFRIAQGFAKIRSNVLLEPPALVQYQLSNCECSPEEPCTSNSNCPHRADLVECSPSICSLSSSHCHNRRIANNEVAQNLEIYRTPNTGWGVRTLEPLKQGQFVCEYVGEVMKTTTYLRRYASIKEKQCRYGVEFMPGYVLDATKKGNLARFFNHSCQEYNCEVQRWLVNGQCRVGIFTLKDIDMGEELTYHYGHGQLIALEPPQKCRCNLTELSKNESHLIPAMVRKIKKVRDSSEESSKRNPEEVKKRAKAMPATNNHKMPVFIFRNVRKSKMAKKHLTLKVKSIPELAKSLLDSQPEQRKVLRLLMDVLKDFALYCIKRENVPRRRISHLQRMVKAAFCADFLKGIQKRHVANEPSEKLTGILIERFDATIKDFLALLQRIYDRRRFEAIKSQYIHSKKTHSNDLLRYSPNLSKDLLQIFLDDRKRANSLSNKRDAVKILTAEADLTYMDSPNPVGSFNPDRASRLTLSDNKDEDCVRCICGIMEDDGVMTQCDGCHFWMHADCLDFDINSKKEFICEFCTRGLEFTPNVNIVLNPQPLIKFRGCTYYRTLVNSRGIQVRVNEAVYVERLINDEHKQALKKLHEECAKSGTTPTKKNVEVEKSSKCVSSPKKSKRDSDSKRHEKNGTHDGSDKRVQNVWWEPPTKGLLKGEFHRRDLRTFRVERIFTGPNGQPFVFGVYYARPHETFCDSTRMFYENELFWTPLFDTLPLDSVVGRCLILEPQVWASGRPKSPKYLEEDVFICEYQIDKHQRCFEKILPKNRYFINTESYVFDYYPEKLPLKRDFTPFILPSRSEKSDQKPKVAQPLAINPLTKDMNKQNLESICSRILAIKDPN